MKHDMPRLGTRVGQREQRERAALAAVGDEHLRAVDDVVVAAAPGRGPDGLDVRARVRLREAEAAAGLATGEAREEALPLLLGAVRGDDERHHRVAVQHAGERHPAATQLLDHARVHAHGQREAAVRGGDERAEQAQLPHARDEGVRIAVGVIERLRHGDHLVRDEAAHGRDDRMGRRDRHRRDSTMEPSMPLDDVALSLQALLDRFIRRMRLGKAPRPGGRRLLIAQIDGLPRSVLEQGLAEGRMPFLQRLLERGVLAFHPMTVGMPTSTPAFQMATMYGVRPDIPGFHYHDKERHEDIYFPRAGDANHIESTQARGRDGILGGGSSYGCVFTGGAANNLFSFAMLKRPTGAGILRASSAVVVVAWVVLKCVTLTAYELLRAVVRLFADPVGETTRGW
jgi:hypothetical protein